MSDDGTPGPDRGPVSELSDGALKQAIETAQSASASLGHLQSLLPEGDGLHDGLSPESRLNGADSYVDDFMISLYQEREGRVETDDYDYEP